jgi:CHAT domain-containing protein
MHARLWRLARSVGLVGSLSVVSLLLTSFPIANAQNVQGMKDAIEDDYAAGRYVEAETAAKALLPLLEQRYGPSHEAVIEVLDRLASAIYRQKRYAEAAQLYERVLQVRRKNLGDKHALVAKSLDGLAKAYWDLGRKDEAKALWKQGVAALPPAFTMPGAADMVARDAAVERRASNLAAQGKLKDAEAAYRQVVGPDLGVVTPAQEALADLLLQQGRDEEAFAIHERMIAIWRREEKGFYGAHILASNLTRLAKQYEARGKLNKEAQLLEAATAARETALGSRHPETLAGLMDLGRSYERQGRNRAALEAFRRVADAEAARLAASAQPRLATHASVSATVFASVVRSAYEAVHDDPRQSEVLGREAFEAAQWGSISRAGAALTQMSARFGAGVGTLARIVRDLQDRQQEWQDLDQQLVAALARTDGAAEARLSQLRKKLAATEKAITDLQARILIEDPRYSELSNPRPLAFDAVQRLLLPEEALYFVFVIEDRTFAWILTRSSTRWIKIPLGAAQLSERVQRLRCGLDFRGAWTVVGSRCRELTGVSYSENDDLANKPLPFDFGAAHALYKSLFGDVEELVRGKQILIVPSGPLTQLPVHVLVTEPPQGTDTKSIHWLARSSSSAVLPTVSSLRALRTNANRSAAPKPYFGVGNPLLDGADGRYATLKKAALASSTCATVSSLRVTEMRGHIGLKPVAFRDRVADIAQLRASSPLPETAEELCDVARMLRANEGDILLGARAREAELKQLSARGLLRSYQVLHFATHGALAGEVSGSTEPGLVMTPPDAASELDDGYLSASEVAGLKLDADWVILSACNTAAGNSETAEALSGLARAFLYAGARALLVSHWYVDSNATVALIKGSFAQTTANADAPKIGRAEAVRRSMLVLIDQGSARFAHPSVWAPFVVVGEGGAGR